jgi:hypothetical protein
MILSKNELRSSSGRIRYRVRVQAGIDYGVTAVLIMSCSCPTTVSYICRCSTIRVPPVRSIRLQYQSCPLVSLCCCSPVRCLLFSVMFVVRCSRSCALVRRALFSRCSRAREFAVRCSYALIRHGCCMQRYIGSCSYLDNFGLVLSVIVMFSVFLWLLASDDCAVN